MSHAQSLLEAIPANPDAAFVLADYLIDQGDVRGQLLRLTYLLCKMTVITAERRTMEDTVRSLLRSGVQPIIPTRVNSIGMVFSFIPPGTFLMGEKTDKCDKPVDWVTIPHGFYLAVTPVTQAQWEGVMGTRPSYFVGENHPVECISWYDSQEFCRKLAVLAGDATDLPTQTEWEYACRAGTTTDYYSGDGEVALGDVGWYEGNCDETDPSSRPVALKRPNAWGLYDMHGNIYEWCADRCHDGQDGESGDVTHRILRGGSWGARPEYCRSAAQYCYPADGHDFRTGFRVCIHA